MNKLARCEKCNWMCNIEDLEIYSDNTGEHLYCQECMKKIMADALSLRNAYIDENIFPKDEWERIARERKCYLKAIIYPTINPPAFFIEEHLKLNNTFENTYTRELSIMSHTHEILELYREVLVATDEKEKDKLWEKYRNQCVDLMLVLISEYDSDPERINARLQKFKEKGALDEESKKEI